MFKSIHANLPQVFQEVRGQEKDFAKTHPRNMRE